GVSIAAVGQTVIQQVNIVGKRRGKRNQTRQMEMLVQAQQQSGHLMLIQTVSCRFQGTLDSSARSLYHQKKRRNRHR
ncbi:MAG: hypothetical protein ACREBR_02140, partial [bacterium]